MDDHLGKKYKWASKLCELLTQRTGLNSISFVRNNYLVSSCRFCDRRGSRGGEMGEFSPPPPPFSERPSFFFSLSLKYWNNIKLISLISLIEVENVHKRWPVLPINLFILSPQTLQPGFGSITLLQKFTPPPPLFQNPGSAPAVTTRKRHFLVAGTSQEILLSTLSFGHQWAKRIWPY